MDKKHTYICIDLKSFYASVECMERNLDPLTTNLVVADATRTRKTICLAVSPSLKAYGIPGRPRLFEVDEKVKAANWERKMRTKNHSLSGESFDANELKKDSSLSLSFITAVPRMAYYMEYSTKIYQIYLKYVAPEDIHVYSIDEVFIDATSYLKALGLTARGFAGLLIRNVLKETGITATAGIGENLYLAKIAMDIMAKHIPADKDGVRIASLTEREYREHLWAHRPITDFWRVGKGYEKKLKEVGLYTMGDIARCSVGKTEDFHNEELLYRLFGVNAELLIDHAWGYEPCTIKDIKSYVPENNSVGAGQVLQDAYDHETAGLVVREMADQLALDLFRKHLVTNQVVLTVGYDIENLTNPEKRKHYHGEVTVDRYGRKIPKHGHGTENLKNYTASSRLITDAVLTLYERITDPALSIRRLSLYANHVIPSSKASLKKKPVQMDLFGENGTIETQDDEATLKKEAKMQEALLAIKDKFGKNAILKGMSLKEGATGRDRNNRIGGHRA